MSLNTSPLNTVPLNADGSSGSAASDAVEATLTQESVQPSGQVEALLVQESFSTGSTEATLTQESLETPDHVEATLTQDSYKNGYIEALLVQNSIDNAGAGTDFIGWKARIWIDGEEITDRVCGEVEVDAEEGLSKIATFKILPLTTDIDILHYTKSEIEIRYRGMFDHPDSLGSLLFKGKVLSPSWTDENSKIYLVCSDMLKESLDGMLQTDLDLIVGGYWSDELYEEVFSGWERAQAMALSQQAAIDFDVNNLPCITQWTSSEKILSLSADDVFDGSIETDFVNGDRVYTKAEITFQYRFTRKRYREYVYAWEMTPKIGCEFLQNPFVLPKRSMIEAACEGSSWDLKSLTFIDLPSPDTFHCLIDGAIHPYPWGGELIGGLVVPDPDLAILCQGFYATFQKKWAQTVTETYPIDIQVTNTDPKLGSITREVSTGIETEFDDESWENSKRTDRHVSALGESKTGDRYYDVDDEGDIDRTAMELARETLQAVELGKILSPYRQNYVSFRTVCNPEIDRTYRLNVAAGGYQFKGKVYQYIHRLNNDDGTRETFVQLALFRNGATLSEGLGKVPAIAAIEKPDTDIVPPDNDDVIRFSSGSETHIGGSVTSPPYSEEWTGFITNFGFDIYNTDPFSVDAPTAEMYPVNFNVPNPEIEEELQDALEVEQTKKKILVEIPNDQFIYSP